MCGVPIVNEDDLEWTELEHEKTRFRRKQLGEATGGEQLGCSLYELPSGHRSWPYHYHTANEEAAGSRATKTSEPAVYPAFSMASRMSSTASSFEPRSGAKPPSSPTAVL